MSSTLPDNSGEAAIMESLQALSAVDFQWTTHTDAVWREPRFDVQLLQQHVRRAILERLDSLAKTEDNGSPLGLVAMGSAGAGKTYLIAALRREVMAREAAFVFVDLTDIRDFWSTTLLGFLDSLQKPATGGVVQYQLLLEHLIRSYAAPEDNLDAAALARLRPPTLAIRMDRLVRAVGRHHRSEILRHQDVLRALVLLASDEWDLSNLGYGWLQGHGIGDDEMDKYGFHLRHTSPQDVVRGLSWLLSLRGPTLLALDQLDAFVTEHNVLARAPAVTEQQRAKQHVSLGILEGIGRGLMELRDATRRTVILVSCIEATWKNLKETALQTATDRYESPVHLTPISRRDLAEALVERRLAEAYAAAGFSPPHPTWPFSPAAFDGAVHLLPRELLKRCESHRRRCLEKGQVEELSTFAPAQTLADKLAVTALPTRYDQELSRFQGQSFLLDDPTDEERTGDLVLYACQSIVAENPCVDGIDVRVDDEEAFPYSKKYPPLHARIQLVFACDNDRERHLCLRVIEQSNAIAYQARLNAAMTISGIDRHLEFRRLVVVRSQDPPSGPKSAELTNVFRAAGGAFVSLSSTERRTILAAREMRQQFQAEPGFAAWLQMTKPVSRLSAFASTVEWLFAGATTPGQASTADGAVSVTASCGGTIPPTSTTDTATPIAATPIAAIPAAATPDAATSAAAIPAAPIPDAAIPVGRQIVGGRLLDEILLPVRALGEHVAALGGAGAGKTVLLRRLVEESALSGIPSIVVDGANDLARLGDDWPSPPQDWSEADAAKAKRYHDTTDVMVWTPGRESGNPLTLAILPDMSQFANDPDELQHIVEMATSSLSAYAAGSQGDGAR
ncbi:MAG: ATPase, partial [Pseudomonadota bacterium]